MRKALQMSAAFGLGLALGFGWGKPSAVAGLSSRREIERGSPVCDGAEAASAERGASAKDAAETVRREETSVPLPSVELTVDDASEPEPAMAAAHASRRARRLAARAAREKERSDFLASLNLDLLSPEQRARHALYLEANAKRDLLRRKISALRAAGKAVSEVAQAELADAEAVLRADREAELRALREAAARAVGLDEAAVRQLMENLTSVENVFGR